MPRGSKESYTGKQKRMASHIEESEKKRGLSSKRAAAIGWATVNKETGGGKNKSAKSSSTRKSASSTARKTTRRSTSTKH